VHREVAALLAVHGRTLGEPTAHVLRPDLPRHLLREALRDIKKGQRRRDHERRASRRHTVVVHCADTIWSDDETHLGRDKDGTEVRGKVLREVACRRSIDLAVGGPAKACDVLRALQRTAEERGGYPLVYSSDNGSPFVAEEVEDFLRRHRIVHLRNVVRTPEHNTWAEKAIGELKAESGLGKGVLLLEGAVEGRARLHEARRRLDELRPRKCLGWRTPLAMDTVLPRAYNQVDRDDFYEAACRAVERAVHGIDNPRARRRAEREAIFRTLHVFGLVTRYRGGREIPIENAEGLS
jgi:transposase InsO family protein